MLALQYNFTGGDMANASGFQLCGTGPEIYESCWVGSQMGKCAEELVATADVQPGQRVLDVGCGTGVVARAAAGRTGTGCNITGTDLNEGMLESARKFAAKHGLEDIVWQRCDATAMPFEDESFDVVLCQQGLQFMPDRRAAMREMARVLASGGRLAVSVWRAPSPYGVAVREVMERRFGEGATDLWQVVYSLGDRDELRSLAEDAGLERARVHYDIKFARHPNPEEFVFGALAGSPLADDFAALEQRERSSIVRDIVAALSTCMDDDGLAMPAECHTLTAEKSPRT